MSRQELDLDDVAERTGRAAGVPVTGLRPLPGGLSSITLAAQLGDPVGTRVVVKVAPPGLEPVRNRDVLRQARLLRALSDVDGVAVPGVLFTDDAAPPLFAMTYVDGESFEPSQGDHPLPPPDELRARFLEAARMLAALHSLVPGDLGLGDEPVGTVVDEVTRWEKALDTVDDDLRAGYQECADALRRTLPAPVAPAVLHGDWRLGNMLCRGGRVLAVIDWEIWSVGDPRVDLAWFLRSSVYDGNPFATRTAPGMPDRSELLAAYEAAADEHTVDLDWFDALVRFKSAATMGLILKRNRRQPTPDPTVEAHAPTLPLQLRQATELLSAR